MSAEVPFVIESVSGQPQVKRPAPWAFVAARIPRLICSQNPFYLISVCCVLHAAAQWFTGEQGPAFSPWPLLGLITGYIALLALTGYVIVRYGKVWDDARSILLLILLLFVELSMLFDETLVRDPATGKWLLLAGLGFAMGLSELLLHGLKIRLPWLFKIPYHLMLGLLFVYPLWLVSPGIRLPMETVLWRIVLFPVVAGLVFLTLIPAIRQSPTYTQPSGTPWRWPWYPWSLFVFLGICIAFRAYAISLSFDPVLNESLSAAMTFESTFGVYLLVPLILAAAVLLLETGVVSNRKNAIGIALGTPLACLYLSVPAAIGSGPYQQMLSRLVFYVGSPLWLTTIAAITFYSYALIRRVRGSETLLILMTLLATRIGPGAVDLATLSGPQLWPALLLGLYQFAAGLFRCDSRRIFAALVLECGVMTHLLMLFGKMTPLPALAITALTLLAGMLVLGGIYQDEFAWLLRVSGAPLILVAVICGLGTLLPTSNPYRWWTASTFTITLASIAAVYSVIVRMKLYQLSALMSSAAGFIGMAADGLMTLIRDSSWKGAASFSAGLFWFVLAVVISCWKAGWLRNSGTWITQMMRLENDHPPAT